LEDKAIGAHRALTHMHQADRLAGTGGHYRGKEKAVLGQDREGKGAQQLTYWDMGRQEAGGQEAMQEGQSPACRNRF